MRQGVIRSLLVAAPLQKQRTPKRRPDSAELRMASPAAAEPKKSVEESSSNAPPKLTKLNRAMSMAASDHFGARAHCPLRAQ